MIVGDASPLLDGRQLQGPSAVSRWMTDKAHGAVSNTILSGGDSMHAERADAQARLRIGWGARPH